MSALRTDEAFAGFPNGGGNPTQTKRRAEKEQSSAARRFLYAA